MISKDVMACSSIGELQELERQIRKRWNYLNELDDRARRLRNGLKPSGRKYPEFENNTPKARRVIR
jgi:hypothetical protein